MNRPDAISGFTLTPDCPSEAILDAYELKESVAPAQASHIGACSTCIARLDERKSAFSALDRAAMINALHIKTAGLSSPVKKPLFGRAIAALSFAAALGLGAFILVRPPLETDPDRELGTRHKGSIGFEVFVERDGVVQRAIGGSEFKPGDRLRFEVDLPNPAHVLIVGVEADGSLYNTYPATASVASAVALPEGSDQVLPGAVELDEKLGSETLHLVACEQAFDSRSIAERSGKIVFPEGCVESRFVLKKVD